MRSQFLLDGRHDFIAAGVAPLWDRQAVASGDGHDPSQIPFIQVHTSCSGGLSASTESRLSDILFGLDTTVKALGLCDCRYQGHVSAALVLGGVDLKGPHLFTVSPQPLVGPI